MLSPVRVLWVGDGANRVAAFAFAFFALLATSFACTQPMTNETAIVESADHTQVARATVPDDTPEPPQPFITIRVGPGYNAYETDFGVVFAVWADGRVMRSAFPNRVTNTVVQGRLSDSEMAQLREAARVLRDHQPAPGHYCCSHQSVKVNSGPAKGIYTQSLVKNGISPAISEFVKTVWKLEIGDAVHVSGAEHGRVPHDGLRDVYPPE